MKISALAVLLMAGAAASAKDYTTYIGDTFSYHVTALTTDSAGNTYVTGSRAVIASNAPGFTPVNDIFVTKLDPARNLLMTVTMSGKDSDQANSIAQYFSCRCDVYLRLRYLDRRGLFNGDLPGNRTRLGHGVTQINFQLPSQPNTGCVEYFSLNAGASSSGQNFVYVTK